MDQTLCESNRYIYRHHELKQDCDLPRMHIFVSKDAGLVTLFSMFGYSPGGRGALPYLGYTGRAAGQCMVFGPRCPKQGIQFDLPLP